MGRPPLTDEKKRDVTRNIIRATNELIVNVGPEIPTIRKIADYAGVNLATLYKYFKDQDEIRLFACVDTFKLYINDLMHEGTQEQTPEGTYSMSWKLFCRYAFKYPEIINMLFFGPHSEDLSDVVRRYYELFPEQLEGMPECYQGMLLNADLYRRNYEVLEPILEGKADKARIELINELTVLYFSMLLNERIKLATDAKNDELTERMMHTCTELLKFV